MDKAIQLLRSKLALAAAHQDSEISDWAIGALSDLNRISRTMPDAWKRATPPAAPVFEEPAPPSPSPSPSPSPFMVETIRPVPEAEPGPEPGSVQYLVAKAREAVRLAGGGK